MGIDRTREAIDNLIRNRGDRAQRIWRIMGGLEPGISPEAALRNLEQAFIVLRPEMIDEAAQLAKDIRAVLENPPIPSPGEIIGEVPSGPIPWLKPWGKGR